MTDTPPTADHAAAPARDYKDTLFLPRTDFPMRANLPTREPERIAHWDQIGLYGQLRAQGASRPKFVLHDGPPYANGAIHIGHAENKTLKDFVVRSRQMMGFDSDYIPGWDCHGLPIEWKVEEDFRAQGKKKGEIDAVTFRQACRAYAGKWIPKQLEEFRRLGIEGDWAGHYTTMAPEAEAAIAAEFLKVVRNGLVYRGSKPVMWSPVERTSLAEAEVEYHEKTSTTIWVKFPVRGYNALNDRAIRNTGDWSVVIWTTTPWTIPGNRAISYSPLISYGLYKVVSFKSDLPYQPWARVGESLIVADNLIASVMDAAGVASYNREMDINPQFLDCNHPLHLLAQRAHQLENPDYVVRPTQIDPNRSYSFDVPLLPGEHVTDDTGTGFVHTAPGHGAEDYAVWLARGHSQKDIPFTVDADGRYTAEAPGFEGLEIITLEGKNAGKDGPANKAVIEALIASGSLLARGTLKHQYPHSWRSKAPLIFRATPQWFIAMDKPFALPGEAEPRTLRQRAMAEIDRVDWGQQRSDGRDQTGFNRIRGMIADRPDWLISRQRNWGVPLAMFVHRQTGEILKDDNVDARILQAMREDGADAWWARPAAFFLGGSYAADDWEKVEDILDVWFDSGCTHAFTLGRKPSHPWPADVYLEGSDQHRGWFQSSLLVGCATRGRAPYDAVVTHGFLVDEQGRKMSKSLGNGIEPQDLFKQTGAEILRVAVASADFGEDMRLGKTILDQAAESYRKLRNTLRYLLGALDGYTAAEAVSPAELPELERWVMHHLSGLSERVQRAWAVYDFRGVITPLVEFANVELSAIYFDIRKDALYCDPTTSLRRRAARTVMAELLRAYTTWLAPILPFTADEAWGFWPLAESPSVHLETFHTVGPHWRDEALATRWQAILGVRSVINGALEIERRERRIGSSLEAAPVVHVSEPSLWATLSGVDLAEVAITSAVDLTEAPAPADAFRLPDVAGVAVQFHRAEGQKCARSWKYFDPTTADPRYPDITPRDAEAVAEWESRHVRR
jgi:isoleucyl-tRNA synthetase